MRYKDLRDWLGWNSPGAFAADILLCVLILAVMGCSVFIVYELTQ